MREGTETTERAATRAHEAQNGVAQLLAMVSPAGPWVIRAAATLGLADLIAGGVTGLAELARAAAVDEDALARLMRYLTVRGIFKEVEPGRFGLTAAARLLQEQHPARLRAWLDLDGAGGRMDRAWPQLLESVRSGRPAYAGLYGRSFWDDLVADGALAASFEALMAVNVAWTITDVTRGCDWSAAAHVMDVGGGNGDLLAGLLRAHPHLRGTLFEAPATIPSARKLLAAEGLEERCALVAGSFFDPIPAGADVYVLSNVLHDWDDRASVDILRGCARAAGHHGRVVIVERARTPANELSTTEEDLRYLVVFGGRTRTVEQFRALAHQASLEVAEFSVAPSGIAIVQCLPSTKGGRA